MSQSSGGASAAQSSSPAIVAMSWLAVGLPLVWGVSQTLAKAMTLFQ